MMSEEAPYLNVVTGADSSWWTKNGGFLLFFLVKPLSIG
jgi:hypothetical protein